MGIPTNIFTQTIFIILDIAIIVIPIICIIKATKKSKEQSIKNQKKWEAEQELKKREEERRHQEILQAIRESKAPEK